MCGIDNGEEHMTDRELLKMALDAMESFESGTNGLYKGEFAEEIKALGDRLAQPEMIPITNGGVATLTPLSELFSEPENNTNK